MSWIEAQGRLISSTWGRVAHQEEPGNEAAFGWHSLCLPHRPYLVGSSHLCLDLLTHHILQILDHVCISLGALSLRHQLPSVLRVPDTHRAILPNHLPTPQPLVGGCAGGQAGGRYAARPSGRYTRALQPPGSQRIRGQSPQLICAVLTFGAIQGPYHLPRSSTSGGVSENTTTQQKGAPVSV